MAASTATEWTSAFCHEFGNMMRDNTRAREPREATLTAQHLLGNHEGVQAQRRRVPTAHWGRLKSSG
ncbi:MAG: hypothetical protein ACREOG_12385 [Gemmatimonadaceae bacterium]